jgi:hypothetical protein
MSGYNLDTGIQSLTLYLDSTNCVSRSPYFKYNLATAINCPTGVRLLLSVYTASLPNVINNITEYNNRLYLNLMDGLTTLSQHTLTLPVGIYSAFSFRDYFNAWAALEPLLTPIITCIYDERTFRFSFVSTGDFKIGASTTCSHLIGVGKNDDNTYALPVLASTPFYTILMPSTVNFNPSPFIFLKMSNIPLSNINSRGVINDTLIRIPVNCNYGEMIYYRPIELNRFLIQVNDINNVELRLEDLNNNPLAIPSGVELQVAMKIDYIYPAEMRGVDIGTISHYFKENPITEVAEEEEIGAV